MCILFPWSHFPKHGGGCCHRNENCNVCMCILFPWSPISPNMDGLLTEMRIAMSVYVYYSLMCQLFPQTWRGLLREMRIAMSVCVYYSLDHLFPQHGGGCSQKWELQCLYVYIIPLITYFPNMEGVAERNENCNVCMCILFPWSPISPTWMGSSQKWKLQCLYVYIIPLITYFPNMEGLLTAMRIPMYICILFPWSPIFQTWRGLLREMRIAMSVCVYYSLDHLFPQHDHSYFPNMDGLLTEMRIAMSVYVYYSLDHLFPQHGGGCSQKWELQCRIAMSENNVYIIPLITYFPDMDGLLTEMRIAMSVCVYYSLDHVFPQTWRIGSVCVYYSLDHLFPQTWRGLLTEMRIAMSVCVYYSLDHLFPQHGWVAHRNENCNVCMCILFPWSPISQQTWNSNGITYLLTEMRIAMSVCVYYSLDHLFPQHGWVAHSNENCNVYMYIIPLVTYFPKHGGGCSQKWELQCMYVYIIPLITYFPNMEGVAHRNENCNVCMCILFPWSPISPTWRGLLTEMRIAMSVCVYYSLDHLFPRHGGGCSWELQCLYVYIIPLVTGNENCNVCICILFPWSPISPNMEGVAHRNENCNVCMCILFPWSPISPNMDGYAHRFSQWRGLLICNVCMCILFPWSPISPNMEGAHRNENCNVCMCILFPWSPISPNMEGVAHRNENCNVCMCILFPWSPISPTWMGSSQKWKLQCLYVYIIPLITYFPNMEGVAHSNENCNVYMYIIPLITYFPDMEGVAERNENCNVCMCILFPWSPISPTWMGCSQQWEFQCLYMYIIPLVTYFPNMEGVATEMRIAMSVYVYYSLDHLFPQTWRG